MAWVAVRWRVALQVRRRAAATAGPMAFRARALASLQQEAPPGPRTAAHGAARLTN